MNHKPVVNWKHGWNADAIHLSVDSSSKHGSPETVEYVPGGHCSQLIRLAAPASVPVEFIVPPIRQASWKQLIIRGETRQVSSVESDLLRTINWNVCRRLSLSNMKTKFFLALLKNIYWNALNFRISHEIRCACQTNNASPRPLQNVPARHKVQESDAEDPVSAWFYCASLQLLLISTLSHFHLSDLQSVSERM